MNLIKEFLEEKGMSRCGLQKKLDSSFSIVNAYACNRSKLSLELLFAIAKVLQIDVRELIDSKE